MKREERPSFESILIRIETETPMVGFYHSAINEITNDELGFRIYLDKDGDIACEFDHPHDEGVKDTYFFQDDENLIELILDYCNEYGIE